ncbi:DUF4194 domain-containing protein [Methylophilus sp. TWE2]|uniref:DUF4194 domain-containing protein n=1 Tax=Methylophilus sp. TWE2 TaxID=1662285 RepID=UPI0006709179|nr:DUF4194 domain-containing protein [Methylophilus sp. TWE2]AKR42207.1 hypothetical protein ACJ67_01245 [Methylophilus sp. TWE2]
MSHYWDNLSARTNGQHTSEEFESAAYRLVVEQVIYYADRHSRATYWLIEGFERDFREALAPLGITLDVNRQLRYVYAKPQYAKAGTASVAQTLLALVLRALYDEGARLGQFTDDGEVVCDLVELEEKYRLMTGRELPGKGEFSELMRTMKRWGIAKKSDESLVQRGDSDQTLPYAVIIRPAIADILGEMALLRLAQWKELDHMPRIEDTESEDDHEVTE